MRICIQFSYPEDADLIWLRCVAGRRFPGVIRECVAAWANGLSFIIDTPLEVPASTPIPHESVKTILFIDDETPAGKKLGRAQGKPALIRDLLRNGAGQMFAAHVNEIWEKAKEPLSVDVKIPKKYADSFVCSNFRSPGDYERSLYLAVASFVNGTPFDRDPTLPDDLPLMPSSVTVRFDRERDKKILEVLAGIPEPLRGCFLRNILHTAVASAHREADRKKTVVVRGEETDASCRRGTGRKPGSSTLPSVSEEHAGKTTPAPVPGAGKNTGILSENTGIEPERVTREKDIATEGQDKKTLPSETRAVLPEDVPVTDNSETPVAEQGNHVPPTERKTTADKKMPRAQETPAEQETPAIQANHAVQKDDPVTAWNEAGAFADGAIKNLEAGTGTDPGQEAEAFSEESDPFAVLDGLIGN